MPKRKEDEIMAEYLLKGGKMLEKCCASCGCPMFEYKGKTSCVVCAEYEQEAAKTTPVAPAVPQMAERNAPISSPPPVAKVGVSPETKAIEGELSGTLLALCHRIRSEGDPDRCLVLMDSVKIGAEALQILRQL